MKKIESEKTPADIFFFGEYLHSLDSQRRLAIPKNWRSKAGVARFFLLPGRNKALQLIPFNTFREFLKKTGKVSFADESASLALARLGAVSQECECDSQGRISIPQRLIDYAELKSGDEAMLVGAIATGQIWSKENWRKNQTSDENVLNVIQKIDERPDDLINILKGRI